MKITEFVQKINELATATANLYPDGYKAMDGSLVVENLKKRGRGNYRLCRIRQRAGQLRYAF